MAKYQILYWRDIPTQLKVWDDFDEVKMELDAKFMTLVDAKAQQEGLADSEDYLAHFIWSAVQEEEGEPADVAEKIKKSIESSFL